MSPEKAISEFCEWTRPRTRLGKKQNPRPIIHDQNQHQTQDFDKQWHRAKLKKDKIKKGLIHLTKI